MLHSLRTVNEDQTLEIWYDLLGLLLLLLLLLLPTISSDVGFSPQLLIISKYSTVSHRNIQRENARYEASQNFNRWFELFLSKRDFNLFRMNNNFRWIGQQLNNQQLVIKQNCIIAWWICIIIVRLIRLNNKILTDGLNYLYQSVTLSYVEWITTFV